MSVEGRDQQTNGTRVRCGLTTNAQTNKQTQTVFPLPNRPTVQPFHSFLVEPSYPTPIVVVNANDIASRSVSLVSSEGFTSDKLC